MLAASGVVTGLLEFYRQSPNFQVGRAETVVTVPALARNVAE
jgi:hypothetical protein